MQKLTIKSVTGLLLFLLISQINFGQQTEVLYLSGKGNNDPVMWDFYCTAGRNSGKWSKIAVPSNWEVQGFGTYNYGHDEEKADEQGLYKYKFTVPGSWRGKHIFIVFGGAMTDTEVRINGKSAGPVHQGGFYQFRYNITRLVRSGSNLLEVKVSKASANASVDAAERKADFWVFGGIFRPVWLEACPSSYFDPIAIDAKADGNFSARVLLGGVRKGQVVEARVQTLSGELFGNLPKEEAKGDTLYLEGRFNAPALWSPEFPNLYELVVTLTENGKTLHYVKERFGFRTVEVREKDGIYINGVKIMFRGVNRHSFWPSSGRVTSRQISFDDAGLIKDMNMNAVRMSHYPPDPHFLDACDSLGLFVLDELTAWQYPPYDTEVGIKLVRELVTRDVNHPCVVMWDNGNEGGFNFELVPEYARHDPQNRPVIHPRILYNGMNTHHYIPYNYGVNTFFNGTDIFFPTEFNHGLYDGGHGANLQDFRNLMLSNPLSAGGFLWDFCDQGVVRTDKNGILDTDGNHGADGILGPYREKEGSFYAIKELWAPVFFEKKIITRAFNGKFNVGNRYFYTNLKQCNFKWSLKRFDGFSSGKSLEGDIASPDIPPQSKGILQVGLPGNWKDYDALYITATDPSGREIYTWSWNISTPAEIAQRIKGTEGTEGNVGTGGNEGTEGTGGTGGNGGNGETRGTGEKKGQGMVICEEKAGEIILSARDVEVSISSKTGLIDQVKSGDRVVPLTNGPILIDGECSVEKIEHRAEGANHVVEVSYKGTHRFHFVWTMYPSGWLGLKYNFRQSGAWWIMGVTFSFPEDRVKGAQLLANGPYRVWKNRMEGVVFGNWKKEYNNTVTGESWDYPEFKGYYSNFCGARIFTPDNSFTVLSAAEGLSLHLFTPETPKNAPNNNTSPVFPSGDLSFLHGISPIGTKFHTSEEMGPQGQKNMYYPNEDQPDLEGVLYFDFRQNIYKN